MLIQVDIQEDKQDLKIGHEDGNSREEKTETIEALEDKPEILISIKEKEDLQTTEKENVGVVETTKTKQQEEKLDNKESTKDWNWAQSVRVPSEQWAFFKPENVIFWKAKTVSHLHGHYLRIVTLNLLIATGLK